MEHRKHEIIGGKKFKYPCKCKVHSLDCVALEMWDDAVKRVREVTSNAR